MAATQGLLRGIAWSAFFCAGLQGCSRTDPEPDKGSSAGLAQKPGVAPKPQLKDTLPAALAAWKQAGGDPWHPPWLEGDRTSPMPSWRFWRAPRPRFSDLPSLPVFFGLHLDNTWVTDEVLRDLKGRRNLHTLKISNSQQTVAGLAALADLPDLHTLDLSGQALTVLMREQINHCKSLRVLRLTGCSLPYFSFKELAELAHLEKLNVGNTQVHDESLDDLAIFKNLHTLGLGQTKVTDAGLKKLVHVPQLKVLELDNTKVTDKGVEKLRAALPKLQVIR